jgi:23S rRNA pseudouridine955/2504/2580 synthase
MNKISRVFNSRFQFQRNASTWIPTQETILYEDPFIVAINKPAGVATQGGSGLNPTETIDFHLPRINGLLKTKAINENRFDKNTRQRDSRFEKTESNQLRLVHRLDKEVSGVLLLGRSRSVCTSLMRVFSEGGEGIVPQREANSELHAESSPPPPPSPLEKTYVAIVGHALPRNSPSIGYIRRPVVSVEFSKRGAVLSHGSTDATTKYQAYPLIKHAGADSRLPAQATLLYLHPMTGRKHQLRQHVLVAFNGVGILGDRKYKPANQPLLKLLGVTPAAGMVSSLYAEDLCLHSYKLRLHPSLIFPNHPKKELIIKAPYPDSFDRILSCYSKSSEK